MGSTLKPEQLTIDTDPVIDSNSSIGCIFKAEMTMSMNVKVVSTENIKPSSPTPLGLKTLELSWLDKFAPTSTTPVLLFYMNVGGEADDKDAAMKRSNLLKTSLSETLTSFYPLAGRIKGSNLIDCNDEGVEYVEAQVDCNLADILKQPHCYNLAELLPGENPYGTPIAGHLLLVQANFFKCGGVCIGVCLSHRLADASAISTFVKGWAATSVGRGETVVPEFNAASFLPCKDNSSPMMLDEKFLEETYLNTLTENCVVKRFVFPAEKISYLKSKIAKVWTHQPTRVESVCALIWKSVLEASESRSSNIPHASIFLQVVNMRKRHIPPLSKYLMGNATSIYAVGTQSNERELHYLVDKLRKGLQEFSENDAKEFYTDEGLLAWSRPFRECKSFGRENSYGCSSWCNFPLYDADFGWGQPNWVSIFGFPTKNSIILVDTKERNGIEAWVTLPEKDMILLECNEELLAYAAINPSVIS